MITYGIDAHLLLREHTTGVPRYAWLLLQHMMTKPLQDGERVILYGHAAQPSDLVLPTGWSWSVLHWPIPRGWTHGRLSLEMMMHPPDVLFVPGHEVPLFVRKSTKVVTTLHDVAFRTTPEVYDPSSRRRQEMAVQQAIRRATIITSPSEATKHDLVHLYGMKPERIVVTPLAPTILPTNSDASDLLRRLQIGDGQYVLSISRLEKKKNTALLIRAFAALKRKLGKGHPLKLVLAGTFGYGEQEIRHAITQEGVHDDVRLTGYVSDDDASLLLSHALCFAFPSRAEGFGIPVLEAMAHGTPVVSVNIPAIREVAGDAAVLVSPNDAAALMSAMERMLFDPSLRNDYRARGSEHVKRFSWDATAETTWLALRSAYRIQ